MAAHLLSPAINRRSRSRFERGRFDFARHERRLERGVLVLSSTSAVSPMGNWASIATNLFDANGNFDATNLVSPGTAQRFYRILVGGAIVQPPGTPPELTTMPTNLTVLAGQSAAFYGAATATTPLTYQWFFNTTTPDQRAPPATCSASPARRKATRARIRCA